MAHQCLFLVLLYFSFAAAKPCGLNRHDALLIIDVQNDFMEETNVRTDRKPLFDIPGKQCVVIILVLTAPI